MALEPVLPMVIWVALVNELVALPPSLTVVTLADFLAIYDDWVARYPQ